MLRFSPPWQLLPWRDRTQRKDCCRAIVEEGDGLDGVVMDPPDAEIVAGGGKKIKQGDWGFCSSREREREKKYQDAHVQLLEVIHKTHRFRFVQT